MVWRVVNWDSSAVRLAWCSLVGFARERMAVAGVVSRRWPIWDGLVGMVVRREQGC